MRYFTHIPNLIRFLENGMKDREISDELVPNTHELPYAFDPTLLALGIFREVLQTQKSFAHATPIVVYMLLIEPRFASPPLSMSMQHLDVPKTVRRGRGWRGA